MNLVFDSSVLHWWCFTGEFKLGYVLSWISKFDLIFHSRERKWGSEPDFNGLRDRLV